MSPLRRVAVPLRLAAVRARSAPGATALAALGIAAAAAMLAAVLGASLVARDRSLARALDEVPTAQRSVRAAWFGVPGPGAVTWPELDRQARAALEPFGDPTALVLYRQSTVANRFVGIAGAEDVGRWVRLRSGRLPQACRPSRCEVLRIGGEGALPDAPGLRLVVVGTALLRNDVLFGGAVAPDRNDRQELSPLVRQARGYHQPPPPPFVLAEGVGGLVQAPQLARLFRSYAWLLPLAESGIHAWDVGRFADDVDGARAELAAASSAFDVTAPVEEVRAAERAGRTSARRLLVVGGQAAGLLLAFAALAAAAARRDAARWRDRLGWSGAAPWQAGLVAAAGAAATAVVGVLAGWAVGAAASGALARREGVPGGAVVSRGLLSTDALVAALALAAAAAAVIVLAQRPPARDGGRLRPLDVAALGAAAALVIGLLRGEADASQVGEDGTGVFLLLLPGLATFAAGALAARLVPAALGALAARVPARRVTVRLALLALGRGSAFAAVAVGFLVVSLGLALFAAAYRSTLLAGQRDQAAFALPLELRVREDLGQLVAPTEAAPLAAYRGLGSSLRVEPVARVAASTSNLGGLELVGIDADAIPALDGWRDDFSQRSPRELGRLLAAPSSPMGARIPNDARVLRVDADGTGLTLTLVAQRGDDGRGVVLDLGTLGDGPLSVAVPEEARGARLVRLVVRPTTRVLERGADSGRALVGSFRLDGIEADGGPLDVSSWVGEGGLEHDGTTIRYALSERETALLRPPPSEPPPALATPAAAAAAGSDGTLTLRVAGDAVRVRVAAVADRIPGTRGDAVVVDRTALQAEAPPGAAAVSEIWIGGSGAESAAARLRRPPFDVLAVDSRVALARRLETDPLAEVTLATLVAAALVALALAVAGLVLLVLGDARDEREELLDLEAQGAEPAMLRRQLRVRAAILAGAGLVFALAVGAVLAALVVDLVAVTANAGTPVPPLRLALEPVPLAAGLVVLVAAAAAAVGAASSRAVGGAR
jgi:hypothetical protein